MLDAIRICTADYKNPEHGCALQTMMAAYSGDVMGGGKALDSDLLTELPKALAKRKDAYSALAWHEKQVVGLITAFEGFSTFRCQALMNIHDLYVAPPFRQQGIARQLLHHIEALAIARNYCKLTLEVLEGNTPALEFYKRFGFHHYQLTQTTGHALFLEKTIAQETR